MTFAGRFAANLLRGSATPPPPGGGYLRYRLDITANNGDAYCGLDELYGYDTVSGSDRMVLGGGTTDLAVSQSSNFGGYEGYQALNFDQSNLPRGWVNAGGNSGYIRFDVPAGVEIVGVGLGTMTTETARMPSEFNIRVSDDASIWTTVLNVTGETSWLANEIRLWEVAGAGNHRYGECQIVDNNGGGYCSMGDLLFFLADGDVIRYSVRNTTIRRSSVYDGGYEAINILNRSSGAYWVSNSGSPQWIDFYCAFPLAEFGLKCIEPNRMPRDFDLYGFDLGTQTFVLINSYTGETGWGVGETRRFVV